MFKSRQTTAGTLHENHLIESNLGLVYHIASRYRSASFPLEDLVSVGSIGLVKAARTYSADRGARFSTYASRCVANEILMYLRQNLKHSKTLSLDAPVGNDRQNSTSTIADLLGAHDEDLEHGIEQEEERTALHHAVSRLSPRSRALISMRYGLYGHKKLCQAEIAENLGISQSYVSRLEKQSLRFLRRILV